MAARNVHGNRHDIACGALRHRCGNRKAAVGRCLCRLGCLRCRHHRCRRGRCRLFIQDRHRAVLRIHCRRRRAEFVGIDYIVDLQIAHRQRHIGDVRRIALQTEGDREQLAAVHRRIGFCNIYQVDASVAKRRGDHRTAAERVFIPDHVTAVALFDRFKTVAVKIHGHIVVGHALRTLQNERQIHDLVRLAADVAKRQADRINRQAVRAVRHTQAAHLQSTRFLDLEADRLNIDRAVRRQADVVRVVGQRSAERAIKHIVAASADVHPPVAVEVRRFSGEFVRCRVNTRHGYMNIEFAGRVDQAVQRIIPIPVDIFADGIGDLLFRRRGQRQVAVLIVGKAGRRGLLGCRHQADAVLHIGRKQCQIIERRRIGHREHRDAVEGDGALVDDAAVVFLVCVVADRVIRLVAGGHLFKREGALVMARRQCRIGIRAAADGGVQLKGRQRTVFVDKLHQHGGFVIDGQVIIQIREIGHGHRGGQRVLHTRSTRHRCQHVAAERIGFKRRRAGALRPVDILIGEERDTAGFSGDRCFQLGHRQRGRLGHFDRDAADRNRLARIKIQLIQQRRLRFDDLIGIIARGNVSVGRNGKGLIKIAVRRGDHAVNAVIHRRGQRHRQAERLCRRQRHQQRIQRVKIKAVRTVDRLQLDRRRPVRVHDERLPVVHNGTAAARELIRRGSRQHLVRRDGRGGKHRDRHSRKQRCQHKRQRRHHRDDFAECELSHKKRPPRFCEIC